MTKEEAIKYLQQLYPNGGHCWLDEQRIEAISMAINALQEEPVSEQNLSNVERTVKNWKEPVSEELEEASKEWLRPQLDKSYADYGETKMMELTRFDGYAMLDAIEFGAQWKEQQFKKNRLAHSEKDLELTWEDIKEICTQSVLVEIDLGKLVSDERHYTEVLKRFKERKEK